MVRMARKVLGKEFFNLSTLIVARELLDKYLLRRIEENLSTSRRAREIALMITETEAYDGLKDMALHGFRGRMKRNSPMFGLLGRIHVYFTYGMHWLFNVTTREKSTLRLCSFAARELLTGPHDSQRNSRLMARSQMDLSIKFSGSGSRIGESLFHESR